MGARVLCLSLAMLATPLMAAEPVALHCARGSGEYPDAAITLNERGAHIVHVTYVGYRPSRPRADWSLRDCLGTALKIDATRNIEVRLWYRDRAGESAPEPLEPAGLFYKAANKRIVQP